VGDYYQPNPLIRHRKEGKAKEVRVDLPHFHGNNDVDLFLDCKMKVEQLFEC